MSGRQQRRGSRAGRAGRQREGETGNRGRGKREVGWKVAVRSDDEEKPVMSAVTVSNERCNVANNRGRRSVIFKE
jgi:hypothetical protein